MMNAPSASYSNAPHNVVPAPGRSSPVTQPFAAVAPSAGPSEAICKEERTLAALAYGLGILLPVVAPALIFLTSSRRPFARATAAQAATLQLGSFVVGIALSAALTVPMLALMSLVGPELYMRTIQPLFSTVSRFLMVPLAGFTVSGIILGYRGEAFRIPLLGGAVERTFARFPAG